VRRLLSIALTALAAAVLLAGTPQAKPPTDDDPYDAHDPMRGDVDDDAHDLDGARRGCEGGDGKSCRHLAGMYSDGRGVAVDEERAREFLRRGCETGDEQSCRKLDR
jgi:TPR repeat protein